MRTRVKGRQARHLCSILIDPKHNDDLQKYITGILTKQRQKLIVVNNMPDHVHLGHSDSLCSGSAETSPEAFVS